MRYTFKCPVDGCNTFLLVNAANEDTATRHLLKDYKTHINMSHQHIEMMSNQDIIHLVKTGKMKS